MRIKQIFLFATLAGMLVSCGGNKGGRPNFGDNEYPVVTLEAKSSVMQTTYPATLKGIQDVEIRPKVSGFITQVCVKEGQSVSAGQLLFVIDNATYQAQVRQAQAAVNTATAQMNTAKLTYENNQQLFAGNVIGQFELESAKNNYEVSKAQVAQAKAALSSAQETLSFCYVKSPASGVIGSLPFKVGALVSASSIEPLTTVSNVSTIEAYFSMTEKDVLEMTKTSGSVNSALSTFPTVKLQLADGSIYNHPGKVSKVSGVIDPATGSVSVIAQFSNPEHLLKSGGSGAIVVPRDNSHALLIPQSVVSEVQDKHFVYLVGKDNKVKYTEIKVDPQTDGNNYVVVGGLQVGDRYVTNGIQTLTDGMEIKPITPAQYDKKIQDAQKLGESNSTAKGYINAMSGKK